MEELFKRTQQAINLCAVKLPACACKTGAVLENCLSFCKNHRLRNLLTQPRRRQIKSFIRCPLPHLNRADFLMVFPPACRELHSPISSQNLLFRSSALKQFSKGVSALQFNKVRVQVQPSEPEWWVKLLSLNF